MRARPLLFFSGGTALRELAVALARRNEPVVYVMTPFDSGGSSAVLRQAFGMPAVGDIRSRLLALSQCAAPCVNLLALRLPDDEASARTALAALTDGQHAVWRDIAPSAFRKHVLDGLRRLALYLPDGMPRRGACVGNLILAGLYLRHGCRLDAATALFARLVRARGFVHAAAGTGADLHVRLADGTILCGQHLFTGKSCPPVSSPIREIRLSRPVSASPAVLRWIRRARLVCYPPGSFYSSILAALLPEGIREALDAVDCPRVFMPSFQPDPELFGHSFEERLRTLRRHAPLTHLLLDAGMARCASPLPYTWLHEQGVDVRVRPIMRPDGSLDPDLAADALCRDPWP